MNMELFFFALFMPLGTLPCILWGHLGGDEKFSRKHPRTKKLLHLLHHAEIGSILMFLSIWVPVCQAMLLGFGTGITVDDLLFHSFSAYFKRKLGELAERR